MLEILENYIYSYTNCGLPIMKTFDAKEMFLYQRFMGFYTENEND